MAPRVHRIKPKDPARVTAWLVLFTGGRLGFVPRSSLPLSSRTDLRRRARTPAWPELSGGNVDILRPPTPSSSALLICVFCFRPSTSPRFERLDSCDLSRSTVFMGGYGLLVCGSVSCLVYAKLDFLVLGSGL